MTKMRRIIEADENQTRLWSEREKPFENQRGEKWEKKLKFEVKVGKIWTFGRRYAIDDHSVSVSGLYLLLTISID